MPQKRKQNGFATPLVLIVLFVMIIGGIFYLQFPAKLKKDIPAPAKISSPISTGGGCVITSPSKDLEFDTFYKKYCSANGISIISSGNVPDLALKQAADIAINMLAALPEIKKKMLENGVRVGVIGKGEVTTDMPEYRDLHIKFAETDWDERTRGIGATIDIPLSTGAEENLLCYKDDRYFGENIFLHEFSHTIKDLGLVFTNPSFEIGLQKAYEEAMKAGLWSSTYAAKSSDEYWAEGVQTYFNSNLESDPPDGIHNFVNTRKELKDYDPKLYAIIANTFPPNDWRPTCPK